jgi:membrane protein
MRDDFRRRLSAIYKTIWSPPLPDLPVWRTRAIRAARLVIVVFRDVYEGQITLWTMSLVYTTLLSMVPLLALSFSVLKAFGVHNQIEPLLANLLAPLGEQGNEITRRLIGFIDHVNVGVLGAVGLGLLVYTVVSLMQKIEESFNAIWHVTQLRSIGERFTRYLSALLIGPLLIFAALGVTAMALNTEIVRSLLSVEPLGSIVVAIRNLVPYALVIGAFSFLYLFIPNARVRIGPAIVAGVVGGILWQSAGWAFAAFVATSTRYSAIYSSFAILVLFLIWLYVSWLVLLIGAAVSFYLQHPEYLYARPGEPGLSNRMRERVALAMMNLVATHFVRGEPPWTLDGLTQRLGIPMHSVNAVLEALVRAGILVPSAGDPPAYLPRRELSEVSIADVLAAVRKAGEEGFLNPSTLVLSPAVEDVVARLDGALVGAASGISVRSLVGTVAGGVPSTEPEHGGDSG